MQEDIFSFRNFKSIAIMGGTFDPIHYGHLLAASYVRQEVGADKVIFIPTGKPIHKQGKNVSNSNHRYNMTFLATLDNPNFFVSKMEIDREGITYTIDTIKYLKSILPDVKIYFITGVDAINQICVWKNYKELLEICYFAVVTRPNYYIDSETENFLKSYSHKVRFVEIPMLDISSTYIRDCVKSEKDISYLLPKNVENYIFKFGLYKNIDFFQKYEHITEKLKETLTKDRFEHSLEVAKECLKLAKNYNYDEESAFLAGILHDCAKCFSNDYKFELCEKYGVSLDEVTLKQMDLAHGFLGYFVARDEYGISDENILNAIKYHTVGKENMSILEKIVYIADYIEPTRKPFEHQVKARELAYKNLDDAMEFILKSTINFNLSKNRLIHNLSIIALDFYKKEAENGKY